MADSQPPDQSPPKPTPKSARKSVRKTTGKTGEARPVAHISFEAEEDSNQESSSAEPTNDDPSVAAEQGGISKQEAPKQKSARKTIVKHQSVAPQTLKEGPTSVVSKTSNPSFPPPPTAPATPQVTQHVYTQFGPPSAQVTGSQTGFGGQRLDGSSVPPHQRALYLEQVLKAKQAQQESHSQPSSFTRQGYLPQNQQFAPQIDFANPNFGPPVAFEARPSQQNHPGQPQRRSSHGHHPRQQAPAPVGIANLTPEEIAFQAQAYRDLQSRTGAEFVHSFTGGGFLPRPTNPNFPQPQQSPPHLGYRPRQALQPPPGNPLQRPLYDYPQQRAPSGSRPIQNHRRQSGSISSNYFQRGPAHGRKASIGSMAGPSMSDSMAQNQLGSAMSPAPSQQSDNGKKLEGAGASQFESHFIQSELNMPTPSSMSSEAVDGYTFSHEQDAGDEYVYATKEETEQLLEEMSADMARQAEDTVALEPLDGVDLEKLKRQSVPFVKSTIFGDDPSDKADTWGSLGGGPDEPRQVVMSHENRTLTWREVVDIVQREQKEGIGRITQFADIPPIDAHEVFLLNPNWITTLGWSWIHKDTDALKWVPTSGVLNQYMPRSIDTLTWYNQIITLQSHVDLWLPQPLNYMFAWFQDTPYGIIHSVANPALIQPAFQPGRDFEFTQKEAESLLHMTMTRFRAGLDGKKIPTLCLQQIVFNHVHGWAPTLERLQVLDLMMQIDLVYWFQGLSFRPLHPYTKYCGNIIMIRDKAPERTTNDGP